MYYHLKVLPLVRKTLCPDRDSPKKIVSRKRPGRSRYTMDLGLGFSALSL